jgi:hypothetical protein
VAGPLTPHRCIQSSVFNILRLQPLLTAALQWLRLLDHVRRRLWPRPQRRRRFSAAPGHCVCTRDGGGSIPQLVRMELLQLHHCAGSLGSRPACPQAVKVFLCEKVWTCASACMQACSQMCCCLLQVNEPAAAGAQRKATRQQQWPGAWHHCAGREHGQCAGGGISQCGGECQGGSAAGQFLQSASSLCGQSRRHVAASTH